MKASNGKLQDTRAGILKLSAAWIAQGSYHGTSLSELLRVTGIGKGGFYHHFASKEDLLLEIMLDPIERALQSGQRIMEGNAAPPEKIRALGRELGRSMSADIDSWTAFVREYSALGRVARGQVLERRREYLAYWYLVIDQGKQTGDFRDIDTSVVESILGIFVYTFVWNPGAAADALIDSIMSVLLHGIATTAPKTSHGAEISSS